MTTRIINGCTEDLYANLPANNVPGDIQMVSDSYALQRDTGAAWTPYGPLFKFTKPPTAGSWTSFGTPAALVETNGGLYLSHSGASGQAPKGYYKSAPSAPYNIDVAFLFNMPNISFCKAGFVWWESSSGKFIGPALQTDASTPAENSCYLVQDKWIAALTSSASYNWAHGSANLGVHPYFNSFLFFRFADDNTNRSVWLSSDGQNFIKVFSVGRTDYITPDKVGFFLDNQITTIAAGMTVVHWYEH